MQDTIHDDPTREVVPHTGGFTADPGAPVEVTAPHRARLPWFVAAAALVLAGVVVVGTNRDGGPRDTTSYVTESASVADLEDVVEGTTTVAFADGAVTGVATPVPGVVTDVFVAEGEVPAALAPLVTVDGEAVHALPADAPLYRPLSEGDEGADVEALETALADAGYEPGEVDEVFDADTTAALADWQEEVGLDATGALDLATVVWLRTGAEVASVDVAIGDRLQGVEPLMTVVDAGEWVADVEIDQVDLVDVTVGDRARIELSGLMESIEGTVTAIDDTPVADGVFMVTVTAETWPTEARVGMSGDVEIVTAVIADAVVVPTGVVGGTAAQPTVPVLVDGEPVDRAVELGLVTASQVEVVSGVEPGEAVVLGEDG